MLLITLNSSQTHTRFSFVGCTMVTFVILCIEFMLKTKARKQEKQEEKKQLNITFSTTYNPFYKSMFACKWLSIEG